MAVPLKKKQEIVGSITGRAREESSLVAVDYMGLTVAEISGLRRRMRRDGIELLVSKNTLLRRSFMEMLPAGAEREKAVECLKGPTAITFAPGDPIAAAKHLCDFAKTNNKLKIKGGWYDGKYLDPAGIEMFSRLGSREEIIGRLIMALKGPMFQLVHALNGPATKLVGTLKAVSEKE